MALIPRTLPTRLGAEDKLVDLYVFSLTVFQVLNILGGVAIAAEVLQEPVLNGIPLLARQILAVIAVLGGAGAAFWRHEGRSVWAWLWTMARFSRLPRHAISRPALVMLDHAPDHRWYEVRPPLAWADQPPAGRTPRRRRARA
jgi:hypothetical protein